MKSEKFIYKKMAQKNEGAWNLNLLVLEDEENERKKQQVELLKIEQGFEPLKLVRTRGRKTVIKQNEENKNNDNYNEIIIDKPCIPVTKKISPRKQTRNQIAEQNQKMTDIFPKDDLIIQLSESDELNKNNQETTNHEKEISNHENITIITKKIDSKNEMEPDGNNEKSVKKIRTKKSPTIKSDKKLEKKKKEEKLEKNTKEEKSENIKDNINPNIIDLIELNSKVNISNTEMLLAILEICINSNKYEILQGSQTREFWKCVYEKTEWKNILNKYQSETLRKYWRIIRDINNIPRVMETLNQYSSSLNGENVKLLPVINTISSFIQSNSKSFDLYEKQLTSPQNLSVNTKEKKKLTEPKSESKSVLSKLNKKRSREDGIIEDIKEINKNIMEMSKKKKKCSSSDNCIIELKPEDELECEEINEILESLSKSFDGKTPEEILEIFKNTSFNIQNAYLYLTDPEYYKELGYNDPDDKIIEKLGKSTAFSKLLQLKGPDSINERKRFLKIK